MSTIGIIPIREHSKRFPNKTFADLCGKPLIEWTIEAAKKSNLDSFVVVTFCSKVIDWCNKNKVIWIKRPSSFETDKAPVIDTISWLNDEGHANGRWLRSYDNQMLLQVTNPTRTWVDINESIELLKESAANSVCSVIDVGEIHPYRMFKGRIGHGLTPLFPQYETVRTQALPRVYLRDGSIYLWRTKSFRGGTLLPQGILKLEIPRHSSVRIDTVRDLEQAEKILDHQGTTC